MKPHVLILSGLYDFSTDLVALQLDRAGVSYVRLNREQLSDYRLTLDPLAPRLTIDGPNGTCVVGAGLRAVWFRQPVFLRNTPPVSLSPNEQLERSQWTAFLRGLCVFRDAAWMNYPPATYLAESKPYQLSIAASCGFRVPETLATNSASRIRDSFPETLVIKSLDTVLLREGDDCLFTYTTVNPGTTLRDDSVAAAPLLAQRVLNQKTDVRVTVVGNRLFAVRILSAGVGIAGDWRVIPKSDLEYQDTELDSDTADLCVRLTRQLGLTFAAIDLLETPEGIFFIEVNPTGEWGWLSGTDRPIDEAIATWLVNPPNHMS
ncbi:MAG TPA: RimK-like protein [Pseudaminobacter sp.]|nr:RimK-like protein [Pseudaminobacter sp.]